MVSLKSSTRVRLSIAIATLSALAACGGGGGSSPPTTDPLPPTPPTNPDPPAPPTAPPTTPPTNPPPPTDPAPQPDIKLAAGYTSIGDAARLSQAHWPAWPSTGTRVVDGLGCATSEAYHIHSMLSIYQDGVRLAVPEGIGISSCHYDLHTHDTTGVIHVETPVPKTFTLKQFFSLWGQPFSATQVAGLPGTPTFYVIQNEQVTRVTTDPTQITLEPHKEIVIVTGTPPVEVPRWNWAATGL
jgi:hypothetical protein